MLTYRKIKLDENGQKSLYLGRKKKLQFQKERHRFEKKQNDIQHNSLLLIL